MEARNYVGRTSGQFGRIGASLVLAALVALPGCAALKVGKRSPDEFSVVTSAPLIIPPDYGLRPVEPSVLREREIARDNEIEEVLFGENPVDEKREASTGEMALLRQIGALSVDDDIRDQIRRENAKMANVKEKNAIDNLIWWRPENGSEWSSVFGRGQTHEQRKQSGEGIGSARPDRQ